VNPRVSVPGQFERVGMGENYSGRLREQR
jgi:hypothetical protein